MGHKKKISLQTFCVLLSGAVIVLAGIYFVAGELHRRGTFVDDRRYFDRIKAVSGRYGVDPQLVRAVIFQESRFDRSVIGPKGEIGLMQIHLEGAVADWTRVHKTPVPSHASLAAVDLNLEIGVWYLSRALERWKDYKAQVPLALIQYNAGATRAARWKPEKYDGDVISRIKIPSTRVYVKNIVERYRKYSEGE